MAERAPRRPPRSRLAVAALIGVAAGLGQVPVSLPWITLAAAGVMVWQILRSRRAISAAWLGWATGTGYFAATLFWIVEPFFVDPARHGWMAPFALIGMAGGMALFWALAWGLAVRFAPRGRVCRALAWAVALSLAEAARGWVLTGFPWAMLGHVWIGWAPMQLAAWIGPVGLTALTLVLPALAVAFWSRHREVSGVAVLCFAVLYGVGVWQGARPVPAALDAPLLRLVQPNAEQHLKWDPEMAPVFYRRKLQLTAGEADGATPPDLVIWPETALPTLLRYADAAFEGAAEAAGGAPVVLGIQRVAAARAYNSLVVLGPGAAVTSLYDKHHLVPFGEYLPFGGLLARAGLSAFTAQEGYGYTPGPGPALIEIAGIGTALPLICYEAIFPRDLRAAPGRADFILQITNDAWFGQISGPFQHLAQARLRAVEMGLPMVRVANTGVSAVIDARGRVLASLPLGTSGALDAALPAALPATVYARLGDAPVLILLGLAALALGSGRRRNRIDAGTQDA